MPITSSNQPWPNERIEALNSLLEKRQNDGSLSFKDIGSQLGLNKNQVIGYTRRHFPQFMSVSKVRKKKEVVMIEQPPPVVEILHEEIEPVEIGECSYVFGHPAIGPWNYCRKEKKENSSYCEEHHILTHIPTTAGKKANTAPYKKWLLPY